MRKQHMKIVMGKLALVHRDIRVTDASRMFAYPGQPISHVAIFSHSIFQRYGFRFGRWQQPERVFKLLRWVLNTFNKHHHFSQNSYQFSTTRLSIKPSWLHKQMSRIEMSSLVRTTNPVQMTRNIAYLHDRVSHVTSSALQENKTRLRVTRLEWFVQRIVKRKVRIEENTVQRNGQPILALPKVETIRSVSPVLQKSVLVMGERFRASNEPKQPMSDPPGASRQSGKTSKSEDSGWMTSLNIEQLTERVVRAIDQRIIAQRERMGRG